MTHCNADNVYYCSRVIRMLWKKKHFLIFITFWWFSSHYPSIISSNFSPALSWQTSYFCFPGRDLVFFKTDYTDGTFCLEDSISFLSNKQRHRHGNDLTISTYWSFSNFILRKGYTGIFHCDSDSLKGKNIVYLGVFSMFLIWFEL